MTFAAFLARTLGQRWKWTNGYGGQCMDLVEQYVHDCLSLPALGGNAIDARGDRAGGGLVWVKNLPDNYPQRGDIVVWGPDSSQGIGGYGHIAIALAADSMHLVSYDENFPTGSVAHMEAHPYAGVLGWQHPLKAVS